MSRDELVRLAAFGGTKPPWAENLSGSEHKNALALAARLIDETQALDEGFATEATQINGDGNLSAQGKANRLRAAAQQRVDALGKIRSELVKIENARTKAIESARQDESAEDRVIKVLAQQEVRGLLKPDPIASIEAYHAPLEAGDELTLDAIETAPRLWGGRPDDSQLQGLREHRMAISNPALNQEISHLNDAIGDVTNALATAENELIERGGLARPDAVAEAAAGDEGDSETEAV